jgi:putative peptide maturation system protein
MTPIIDPALGHALAAGAELLAVLHRDRVDADDAMARLAALRRRLGGVELDLVWEAPDLVGDRHYDLLIRHGGLAVSVSACASTDVPWPMRGAMRWSEKDVVIVNGEAVTVGEVITALDFTWRDLDVARHLVDQALLRQLIAGRRLPGVDLHIGLDGAFEIGDDDLQATFDAFRVRRGLEDPDAFAAWLAVRGLELGQLEPHVRGEAARRHVRRAVVGAAVGPHLEAHARDYDRVDALRVGGLAAADIAAARAEPGRLQAIVEQAFLRGQPIDIATATFVRHELAPAVADVLFGAEPGALVGPLDDGQVARVLRVRPARPDEVRDLAEERLFAAWLAERRAAAHIEWLWGPAADAEAVSPSAR